MGKPSAPPAPDYTGAAQAQGAANSAAARTTSQLSNPNVYTPLGSQTVTQGHRTFDADAYWKAAAETNTADPSQFWNEGTPTVTQTLNPTAQKIFDTNQQTQQGLGQSRQPRHRTSTGRAWPVVQFQRAISGIESFARQLPRWSITHDDGHAKCAAVHERRECSSWTNHERAGLYQSRLLALVR
jgi:hypothetical protein